MRDGLVLCTPTPQYVCVFRQVSTSVLNKSSSLHSPEKEFSPLIKVVFIPPSRPFSRNSSLAISRYFAMSEGTRCFCGSEPPTGVSPHQRLLGSECMKCNANPNLRCGAMGKNSVYRYIGTHPENANALAKVTDCTDNTTEDTCVKAIQVPGERTTACHWCCGESCFGSADASVLCARQEQVFGNPEWIGKSKSGLGYNTCNQVGSPNHVFINKKKVSFMGGTCRCQDGTVRD